MNLPTRIGKWLAPPVFEDEDKTRTPRLLNTILVAAVILVVRPSIAQR
jgi:hypothetical protein